jgi:hypothetical protein
MAGMTHLKKKILKKDRLPRNKLSGFQNRNAFIPRCKHRSIEPFYPDTLCYRNQANLIRESSKASGNNSGAILIEDIYVF